MSEQIVTEQPDLSALQSSPGKRKRELESPESQRSKRSAATAGFSADTAAFITNALEASQAAQAAAISVADFSALHAAAAAEHPDASDPSNATSTAQAALGIFPTLHVPPSTEEQFAAQANAEGEQNDSPYNDVPPAPEAMMDGSPDGQNQGQTPTNGMNAHRFPTSGHSSTPKPTVGSEEWHKMRKDNHKEGKAVLPYPTNKLLTIHSRKTQTRDHQRRHQRAR